MSSVAVLRRPRELGEADGTVGAGRPGRCRRRVRGRRPPPRAGRRRVLDLVGELDRGVVDRDRAERDRARAARAVAVRAPGRCRPGRRWILS